MASYNQTELLFILFCKNPSQQTPDIYLYKSRCLCFQRICSGFKVELALNRKEHHKEHSGYYTTLMHLTLYGQALSDLVDFG